MTIDFNAWKTVRGFVGVGLKLHFGRVQERAPYYAERAMCGVGPMSDIERPTWPTDWAEMPECKNCLREQAKIDTQPVS